MSYTIYDNANNVRVKKYAERQQYEAEIKKRDDNAYDPSLYHKKKEGIVDELMNMFQDKFKVTREDFFLLIDRYHIMDTGLTRDILVKVVGELKLLNSLQSKVTDKAHMYSNMPIEYSPNIESEGPTMDIPTFYASSAIKNKAEFEYEKQTELEASTPLDQLIQKDITPSIPKPQPTYQSTSSIPKPQPTPIIKNSIKAEKAISKPSIKPTQPDTYVISYPLNSEIAVDGDKVVNYNGTFISASACMRYNLHEMPYLLLIINKKYKIPIEFKKLNQQFYAHKKYRGPMIVSNEISIELFDFMNNPLHINLMPTEIFHILFETTTQ
jgi:hypothetical protein